MDLLAKIAKMIQTEPDGPGVRVDSGAYQGWSVPMEYDPLIAKLTVWDEDRGSAIARLRTALREYNVTGIRTTLGFFRDVVEDEDFRAGRIDTGFIGRWTDRNTRQSIGNTERRVALLGAGLHFLETTRRQGQQPVASASPWKRVGRDALLR